MQSKKREIRKKGSKKGKIIEIKKIIYGGLVSIEMKGIIGSIRFIIV
jgi:hypothetical protein